MSDVINCVVGDAFETQKEADLFTDMANTPETKAVYSNAWNGGWGHHSVDAIIEHKGTYYVLHASGCSCDGSATIKGPYETPEKALEFIKSHPDIYFNDLTEGDMVREG